MNIRTTDGTLEEYSVEKVFNDIVESYKSIKEEVDEHLIRNIIDNLFVYENMTSAEIRRLVEDALMSINKKVARAYISKYDTIDSDKNFKRKKSDYIKNYIKASNAATGSKFDANANVSNKNVVTMGTELYKEENIKENRYLLYDRIKMMYSKKLADRYIYDLETHRIYKHDETAIPGMPYCVAITMYPFLLDGLTGLGGQSKAPTDLKSYCGEFINLVYSVSSQFAGACMYKDQELFIKNKKTGLTKKITSKELVNEKLFGNVGKFSNFQGDWEYAYVDDLCVAEDGKFVDVNKVYRRKYNGDIYIIKTKDGRTAYVSKDHKFKVFYRGRILEVKAEDLVVNDTVFVNKDFSFIVDDTVDDYKRGWIKGIICGDGCIKNENEVRLDLHKDQLYYGDIFNKYSLSLYNNSLTTIREDNRGGNCFDYSKYNKEFYQNVCCDIIGKSTYDKHIDVDNKSVDFLLGFIDGLLCADGSYTKSKGVTISLTNEKLINNVADIIHMMGYERPTINLIPGKGNRKDSYTLYIRSTFLKYLKHTHLKKLELDNVGDSKMNEISIYGSTALKNTKTNKRNLWSGSHRSENYNLDVIESIEKFHNDDDYVYEIETDTHWYNCGGFITHNCATPEFLMYFDYFVRKDYGDDYLLHLNDKVELNTKGRTLEQVIENGFQQVVHSMNMPAGNRGYQCVREDTTQLMTPNGFKYLSELNEGDCCYVWKDGKLCIEKINKLNVYDFDGEMYQFKGRNYQQTVTDSHRVLYKKPNTSTYSIKEAKDLFGHSKLSLPVGSDGIDREDFPITDELLKLCVITLTDGSIDGVIDGDINSGRIKIYKSKNRWGFKEIPELLNSIGVGFTENEIYGNEFGDMVSFTIPKIDSQIILRQIEHTKKRLPKFMKLLSKRQIDIVIDIWSKTDGSNRNGDIYLQCDNDEILNDLQEIVFLGGYGSMIKKSVVNKFNGDGNTLTNHLHIFKRKDKRVSEYNKIYYKGRVWCPSTDAGIVIFREENGIPYITGNSVFWNVGYFDKGYFEGVFGDFKFPDGTSPKWETLSWLQKKFMKWFNDERTRYTLTFPVETMACLTDGNDLVDEEYADFTSEMYADGHSFFTYLSDSPDSLSSCCRLRNSLKDNEDEEHNHNTHQFSMGTASVATGSKSVMTINLNRIIQNSVVEYFEEMGSKFQLGCKFVLSEQSEDVKHGVINKIKSNITECTENVHKYQTAFNSIIKDFYEANMLDVYRAGFINMRKQYLTVGVNGLTDAAEFLGIDCTDNDNYREFVNDILETINISNKKDKTRECMFNTEFVPGENLSNKNYNWDKKDGYFVSEKHIMYSSYFFNPEDESLSVLEKMRLHGKDYVQYLDGGSACHINLAEHLSKEQNRKLLKYAASVGCNYFTYNVRNTACNKCGYISKHDLDKCPHCGSTDVDKLTRIIGYLKRVKSFAEPRQVEEGMRYYNKTVE